MLLIDYPIRVLSKMSFLRNINSSFSIPESQHFTQYEEYI